MACKQNFIFSLPSTPDGVGPLFSRCLLSRSGPAQVKYLMGYKSTFLHLGESGPGVATSEWIVLHAFIYRRVSPSSRHEPGFPLPLRCLFGLLGLHFYPAPMSGSVIRSLSPESSTLETLGEGWSRSLFTPTGIMGDVPCVFLLLSLPAGCWGCNRSCWMGQKFPPSGHQLLRHLCCVTLDKSLFLSE